MTGSEIDRTEGASYYEALAGRLYAAVVSDALDTLGRRDRVLAPGLSPVVAGDWTLVGRARTARAVPVAERPAQPYALLLRMIDGIEGGDVLVLAGGGRVTSGLFGGLLATAVRAAGGRGAVVDGGVRDVRELNRLAFPTVARGVDPADSLARDEVVAIDEPVECCGVRIESGDLVVADADGTVVVPAALEREVVRLALEKVGGEHHMRRDLADGMAASEAFARHGIL